MADEDSLWGSTAALCTLEEVKAAQAALKTYDDVLRTPLLESWPVGATRISLKLESLQTTGSFKIRGMRYKLHKADVAQLRSSGVVTLSAGNAGRAVSYLGQACGYDAKVFMPATAPDERKTLMESMGATVEKVPGERLLAAVAECMAAEQRILVHPFDDVDIIRGHASCGLEILEDASTPPDVVVVCCGGGGLLAGVAAAVKLSCAAPHPNAARSLQTPREAPHTPASSCARASSSLTRPAGCAAAGGAGAVRHVWWAWSPRARRRWRSRSRAARRSGARREARPRRSRTGWRRRSPGGRASTTCASLWTRS